MKIWDKMAVISDPRYFPKKRFFEYLGLMRRKYISIFEKSNSVLDDLIDFNPNIVRGYPSNLIIMLKENPDIVSKFNPRIIFTSGELIDQETRNIFSNKFNAEHYDFYVCNEFSLLAWECTSHEGYHINADGKYVEILREGDLAASGETGEILVTRLNNPLMPLIRYKIGDVGAKMDDHCACGISFPLLEMVEGRTDDLMITTDGYIVSPLIFFPYPFQSFNGISQFRVIQETRYKITIELATQRNINPELLEGARKSIKKVFGEDMNVDFKIVKMIEPEPSGKIKKIISKVRVPL
jgi:phenylacetate-CoA ligase